MDKFGAIACLKAQTYSLQEVKNIINNIDVKAVVRKPTHLIVGDIYVDNCNGNVLKPRPLVICKVLKDSVMAIPLTTSDTGLSLCESRSRFGRDGWFTKQLICCTKEHAMANFVGVYSNEKLLRKAIKKSCERNEEIYKRTIIKNKEMQFTKEEKEKLKSIFNSGHTNHIFEHKIKEFFGDILKEPLFTTQDGVNIFEGNTFYWINDGWVTSTVATKSSSSSDAPTFSSEDTAHVYKYRNYKIFTEEQLYEAVNYWSNTNIPIKNIREFLNLTIK